MLADLVIARAKISFGQMPDKPTAIKLENKFQAKIYFAYSETFENSAENMVKSGESLNECKNELSRAKLTLVT